jgi:hypothetical protein
MFQNASREDLELDARVSQLVLKRVFDRLFSEIGSTRGDPYAYACLDSSLDELFENLTAPLTLIWDHGNLEREGRLELGRLLTELRTFYDSQKKHLLLRRNESNSVQYENAFEGGQG